MIAPAAASRSGIPAAPARFVVLLLGLLLLVVAERARADCSYTNQPGTVTFTPPATITLPDTLTVGTILWTSTPIVPANYPTLTCYGNTNSGVVSAAGVSVGGDNTLFPTNVTGLSYRLLHPDTSSPLHAYPSETIPAGTYQSSVATALQLIVTGTITPGSTLNGGQLAIWNVDMCSQFAGNSGNCKQPAGPNPVEAFNTSGITFVAPACTIAVDPTVVTLPTVYSSAFTGVPSTTGQTSFSVQLNCPSAAAGASLAITLATSNPAGATGVIAPASSGSGIAKNVGVQVLDKNGNPIAFGTAIPAGTATAGNFDIQLKARYYQTGTPVSGGNVNATATYTITYQ